MYVDSFSCHFFRLNTLLLYRRDLRRLGSDHRHHAREGARYGFLANRIVSMAGTVNIMTIKYALPTPALIYARC